MNELIVKEINFNGDTLVAAQNKRTGKVYVGVSWICRWIGFNKNKKDRQLKNIQEDPLLKQNYRLFESGIFDKHNEAYGIEIKYLPIWLSKINAKSLNYYQYEKIIKLINWCLSSDFNEFKIPTKIYQWEGELRDEIYELGYFDKYKIIGRELTYDFGRIDLLAKDENDNLVVIELKKHKNYNDIIGQCRKYAKGFKEEFNQNVKIVICTLEYDNDFLEYAKNNGFECYTYKRELKLHKVC